MDATSSTPSRKRLPLIIALAAIALGGIALLWSQIGGNTVKDLSGIWKGQTSGQVFVLDKAEDDYRLTVSGHRIPVEHVDLDKHNSQLNLTVRTDSGLHAVWSFAPTKTENSPQSLHLDQDGFQSEELQFQRALTDTDRTRISRLKPSKKPLWSPGFSCEKAASEVERMICTDKTVADLDSRLGKLLKTAGADAMTEQKQWLKDTRDSCTDIACLRDSYNTRLDAVAEYGNAVDPDVHTEAATAPTNE